MRVILDLQNDVVLKQWLESSPFCVALVCLMFLDIVTGLIAAFVTKKLCSTTSYRGMLGKVQILAMVATAMLMQLIIPNVPWGTFVSLFFCITEAISITENAANSGVPIPQQWTDALRKARQEESVRMNPIVSVVVGNDSEVIHEAVQEGVQETKQAVRTAVHDIRDTLNAVSLKAEAKAAAEKLAGESDIHKGR